VSTEESLEAPPLPLPVVVVVVDWSSHDQAADVADAAEAAAGTTGSTIATMMGEKRYVHGDGHVQSNHPALADAGDDDHLPSKG
jgi:hypothetical protein